MPFKSEKQRAWMYANHPEMAARWEKETPRGTKLPVRAGRETTAADIKRAFAKRKSRP